MIQFVPIKHCILKANFKHSSCMDLTYAWAWVPQNIILKSDLERLSYSGILLKLSNENGWHWLVDIILKLNQLHVLNCWPKRIQLPLTMNASSDINSCILNLSWVNNVVEDSHFFPIKYVTHALTLECDVYCIPLTMPSEKCSQKKQFR